MNDRDLQQWAERGLPRLRLVPLATAPLRPREGDVAYADGTNWNPGSGEGAYVYDGSAWVTMGSGTVTVTDSDTEQLAYFLAY